jgi:murein L,D-transpeptidase YafK
MTHLLLWLALALPASEPNVCRNHETAVVVRAQHHALALCEDGRDVARHRVALGSGGLDKRRLGDGKTPLGIYPLGAPRPSSSFGTFVPVGYPTAAQQKQGFTGHSVGIHGPPRGLGGALSTAVDWTAGCIAVGTDAEIQAISTWIRRLHVRTVRIE